MARRRNGIAISEIDIGPMARGGLGSPRGRHGAGTANKIPAMNPCLLYEQSDHVVTLTMNDPQRHNPLTGNTMVDEFLEAVRRIDGDRSVRAVILTGNGGSFSAGGDVKAMLRQTAGEVDAMQVRHDYRAGIQRLPLALFNLEVPVIAAVNGHATGAGLDLACMCDIRIAADGARFAESFVKVGIVAGDGGAWLLPRIIGLSRAAELSYTGRTIDARCALDWNLVSQVVPAAELMACARRLAEEIAANPPHAVRLTKRLIREGMTTRLDTLLELAAMYQAVSHQTPDHREAVMAFIEKRAPRFGG
jgi:enoyl-CoA hydratase/carnithine racemase